MRNPIIESLSVAQVFFSIVGGIDYSLAIANQLGYTFGAADQNIGKLERAKLAKSFRDGRAVRCKIVWHTVACLWADYAIEEHREKIAIYPTLLEEEPKIPKGRVDWMMKEAERHIANIEKLRDNPDFERFVEVYFTSYVNLLGLVRIRSKTLSDVFDEFVNVYPRLEKKTKRFKIFLDLVDESKAYVLHPYWCAYILEAYGENKLAKEITDEVIF